jgi:hypothetical protein
VHKPQENSRRRGKQMDSHSCRESNPLHPVLIQQPAQFPSSNILRTIKQRKLRWTRMREETQPKMSLGKANAKTVAWKARVLLKLVVRKHNVITCLGLNQIRIESNGDTFCSDDGSSGCITVERKQATIWELTPVVFKLFYRTPRCNFSSTLYPQSCWCIIQVTVYNLHLK